MSQLWFDDLEVGMRFPTPGRTVTEADLVNFAGISGDFHPLHMDREVATATRFGERIAHGALILSMVTGMRTTLPFTGEPLVAFAEIRSWTFTGPVRIGDTIHAVTTIAELTPTSRPGLGVVVQRVDVRNQRDELVQGGDMVNLVRSRDLEGSTP